MFFKQKRFRKVPSAIVAIQNEFYIGIDSSKLSEKTLLDIGLTKDFLPLVEGIDFSILIVVTLVFGASKRSL